jgi:acetolactate synthase I/II/III large subunit
VKVSDYIAEFVARQGVRHCFVVQGGAVAHMIDSVGKRNDIGYVCVGHEQAGAIAAHGYAARGEGFGCAIATTGPGIMNLVNGVACLFYDSLPGLFLGGQVTTARYRAKELGVRQLGFQESPHADLLRPVTKYANTVVDKSRVRFELEKAVAIALEGRPGPVFLDFCDDVQRADIDPDSLEGYVALAATPTPGLDAAARRMFDLLSAASRPVLVLGGGLRYGRRHKAAVALAERHGIPILTTWGGQDALAFDHPLNAGGFGLHGPRGGNFAVQNADCVIGLGVRFTQHQTGTPAGTFARGARRIVVDVDPAELGKFPAIGLDIDLAVAADVASFLEAADRADGGVTLPDLAPWRDRISKWRVRYPMAPGPVTDRGIDPYAAILALSRVAGAGDIVLGDVGATLSWMFQAWRTKTDQTLATSFNNHTMGYALPAAVGAALRNPGRTVWSLNGDGGVLMNIQELGVLAVHKLPVKVVVLNNHGYGVIQQTQEDYFDSRYHATTPRTGLMDPDFEAMAHSFGLPARRVATTAGLADALAAFAREPGPGLCVIEIDPEARIRPAVTGGRPIEDTAPLLDRAEFAANMLVAPLP